MTPRGSSAKSSGGWFDRGRARQGAGRGLKRALFRVGEPAPPPAVTRPAGARSSGWRGGSCIRRRRFGCSATCCWSSPARPDAILPPMDEPYRIVDLGVRRVLAVDGREYPTRYSERVIRMLIERKGVRRAPLYFDFKETRGPHFPGPLVRHLPARTRRAQVDEYYRVLAPGGYIAILDTPNRWFPLETHSVGLPLVQWLPPRLAYRCARVCRPAKFAGVPYAEFVADGTGWRNATLADCLPSSGRCGLEDVTEAAGYGWRFFRDTARSRTRRALSPFFAVLCGAARAAGLPPSVCLPYLNLLLRKLPATAPDA